MELGIGPYRLINSKVDLKPHCYKNFTAGKKVIERLEDFACRRNPPILPPGVTRCRDLTASQSGAIFGTIFSELIAVAYGDLHTCNRPEDVVYTTVYNRMCRTLHNNI